MWNPRREMMAVLSRQAEPAVREHARVADYEDIDLYALSDDELVEQMHNDLYDGMRDEIVEGTNILLGRGFTATKVLDDALVAGMKIVGIDFRDGILFVPEVLLAANAMKAGMEILRPLLAETGAEPVGKVVIGTVKGDIHDIGKNLVGMMLEGAGFEVVDLGINTDAEKFIAALELHKPDILGMSALLTTTMPYMKVVIQTLKDRGMRDDYIVLVGGAPLNEEFGHGRRRRRLLPRRRRRRRDGPPPDRRAPCRGVTPRQRPRSAMRPPTRPGPIPTPRSRGPIGATLAPPSPPTSVVDSGPAGARPRHRLRRARARAARRRRADPGPRGRLPPAGPPQPARRHPGRRPAPDPRGPRRRLRADLRRLRRLRHRRAARPGPRRGGRRAPAGRPLLRVLRRQRRRSPRWPTPSPARSG